MSIFSTTIYVPLSTLQDCASKLSEYADDNSDIFDRLLNILSAMESSTEWQGESMTAAISAMESNQSKYQDAINDLNSLAKFLKDFSTRMAEKDAEIASEIQAI